MELLAFDIETTGLDPEVDRVLAVGIAGRQREEAALGPHEADLLAWLERTVAGLAPEVVLVTWNGEEFDLPFLAKRMARCGVTTALELTPTPMPGKYGKPRHSARWGGHGHVDIAYAYRDHAENRGVEWSLKPMARAVLGEDPVEVDRRGSAIAALDAETLEAYVRSDALITYRLAAHLAEAEGSLPVVW